MNHLLKFNLETQELITALKEEFDYEKFLDMKK